MSLSLGPDIDMQAIVNGGPQFVDRLSKLQAATVKHQQALTDLNLGKSAVAANDEAARTLASAREKSVSLLADANKQADDLRDKLASHEAASKAATNDALNAAFMAKTEAEALRVGAADAHKQAVAAQNEATTGSQTIVADAQAKADQITADAKKAADALKAAAKTHHDAALVHKNEAAALKAKLADKLAQMKSLASGD